jgi:hypothetical protein
MVGVHTNQKTRSNTGFDAGTHYAARYYNKTMNYELANRLKKAGFPIRGKVLAEGRIGNEFHIVSEWFPTLSELIEACGEDFGMLRSPKDNMEDYMLESSKGFLWTAQSSLIQGWRYIENGSTPEQAVAELWLALNTKSPNLAL